jgi:hypothetical protein
MIAGGGYPDDSDYVFTLNVINNKAKKTQVVYDIHVDSIYFKSIPPGFDEIIAINFNLW